MLIYLVDKNYTNENKYKETLGKNIDVTSHKEGIQIYQKNDGKNSILAYSKLPKMGNIMVITAEESDI